MRIFIFTLLFNSLQLCAYAQHTPVAPLKQYLQDAIDNQLSTLALADKYFCSTQLHQPGLKGEFAQQMSHTYVALYHRKIACYFLLQDASIASTLILGMGEEHMFINYCATP